MVNCFAVFKSDFFPRVASICAFGIFVWFVSLDIGSIKRINVITGTTFGVYLIYNADISRTLIWYTLLQVDMVQYVCDLFPIYAMLSIVGVFYCCLLLFADGFGREKWIEPWAMECFWGLMKRVKCLVCE